MNKSSDIIKQHHYKHLEYDENGVRTKPLFIDFVGKLVWFVNEENPIYCIDISVGISFDIIIISQANYGNIIAKSKGEVYGESYLYFSDRNDANKFIKKAKELLISPTPKHR